MSRFTQILPMAALVAMALSNPAAAGSMALEPVSIPVWKAVYGQIEARNNIPARARISGTLVSLDVTEGDEVTAGQVIGTLRDDKIAFEVTALDAQLRALEAQLENANTELARGEALLAKGVVTVQRLDQLRTQADVYNNQIAATEAQRQVIVEQVSQGDVLAPSDGKVLNVPVTEGAVVMAGETIAGIGGGGLFLRLAIPERHAPMLRQGATLEIETGSASMTGELVKIYPQITDGRVIADVDVEALPTAFVGSRLLVRVPVGEREALLIPANAVSSHSGLDFVRVTTHEGESERVVVLGEAIDDSVEILTGLTAGDEVLIP